MREGFSQYANSNPIISNCLITGNTGTEGHEIYNDASSPVITNCKFTDSTQYFWTESMEHK